MTWHRNVRGNLRTIANAMRLIRPLVFMPTPSVKAESKSHQVDDANVENVAPTEIPATTTKSTAITKLGQNAGNPPHDSHDEDTEHRRCLIGQSRNRAGRDKDRRRKRTRRSTSQLDPSLRFLFHQHTPSLAIDAVNHTPK